MSSLDPLPRSCHTRLGKSLLLWADCEIERSNMIELRSMIRSLERIGQIKLGAHRSFNKNGLGLKPVVQNWENSIGRAEISEICLSNIVCGPKLCTEQYVQQSPKMKD